MRSTAKNKSDRMIKSEVEKLVMLVPAMLTRLGFKQQSVRAGSLDTWVRRCGRFDEQRECFFRIHPIMDEDGHPWLACEFDRDGYRDPSKPWDDRVNRESYRDIRNVLGNVNQFTGKFNEHIFERLTAVEVLVRFERHICYAFGEPDDYFSWRAASNEGWFVTRTLPYAGGADAHRTNRGAVVRYKSYRAAHDAANKLNERDGLPSLEYHGL